MRKQMSATLMVLTMVFMINVTSAMAAQLYGTVEVSGGNFKIVKINSASGIVSDVSSDLIPDEIESLTWAGGNTYYGMQSDNGKLYEITITDTSVTYSEKCDTGFSNIDALTYVDGLLYGLGRGGTYKYTFFSIDPVNECNIVECEMNNLWGGSKDKVEGLAYLDGVFYAGKQNEIHKITPTFYGCPVSELLMILDTENEIEGFAFSDGLLYAVLNEGGSATDYLYEIDVETATVTDIIELDSTNDIEGLAHAPETTLIELSSFTASADRGVVVLSWETGAEIDNAGFNLYRAESENGEYEIVNSTIISAEGSMYEGASYELTDNDVENRNTYYYKLEDIDTNGTTTTHGPVSATPLWMYGLFK